MNIIFEDNDIIIVYKEAGLATQSAKTYEKDLVSLLKKHLNGGYVGIVHRLDQPVEGLLCFGKTPAMCQKLNAQLADQTLQKTYLAYVVGQMPEKTGTFEDLLCKEGSLAVICRDKSAVPNASAGKDSQQKTAQRAVLHYTVMQEEEETSLLKITIDTGRFHQIRAQLSYHGHPLLGDTKYGNEQSERLSREKGIRHVALCADEISLRHPKTGKSLHFSVRPTFLA